MLVRMSKNQLKCEGENKNNWTPIFKVKSTFLKPFSEGQQSQYWTSIPLVEPWHATKFYVYYRGKHHTFGVTWLGRWYLQHAADRSTQHKFYIGWKHVNPMQSVFVFLPTRTNSISCNNTVDSVDDSTLTEPESVDKMLQHVHCQQKGNLQLILQFQLTIIFNFTRTICDRQASWLS